MALLELEADRALDPEAWPDCCARCTAPGTALVPIPGRYAMGVAGIAVPMCPAHADDWAAVRFRNRVGAVIVLCVMAVTVSTVWVLHPDFAKPNERNTLGRVGAAIALGLFSAMPIGAVVAWWAKSPIRVFGQEGRKLTLAGVSWRFAKVAKQTAAPPPLPTPDDAARFDVSDYRPAPTCPPGAASKAVGIAAVIGAVFGGALGVAGLVIADLTAGWPRNDWRYLGLVAIATVVYVAPTLGPGWLLSRFGVVAVGLAAAVVVVAVLVLRVLGLPLEHGFAGVLAAGPMLLLYVYVVNRAVWRWRIRSGPVAALIGALGPAAFLAVLYLTAGLAPGPHKAGYAFGLLGLLSFPLAAGNTARSPYCAECDAWLEARRIGALPRAAADVRPALAAGQVVALAGLTASDAKAPIGDVELKVHSCSNCRERGTVVLELFDCRAGGKNGKTPMLVKVGRWRYPGTALLVVETMFPPESPEEPAPPPERQDQA